MREHFEHSTIFEIKNLIDGKTDLDHIHSMSDVTGLGSALDAKASSIDVSTIQTWLSTPENKITVPTGNLSTNQTIVLIGNINATNTKVNELCDALSSLQSKLQAKGLLTT